MRPSALTSSVFTFTLNVKQGPFHVRHREATPDEGDDRDACRFVDLLRRSAGDRAAKLDELRELAGKLRVDAKLLLSLAFMCAPEGAAIQMANRLLHARSEAARSAAADERAAGVRRAIDGIRRREGDLTITALAARLNALRIPAPRGGTCSGAQVYRVLKRTGEGRRPKRKNTPAAKKGRPKSGP